MNRKLSILKSLRNMISPSKPQRFYTVEEKREMALRGEPMPICVGRETRNRVIREYIVPFSGISSNAKHKKIKKMKI